MPQTGHMRSTMERRGLCAIEAGTGDRGALPKWKDGVQEWK